MPLSRARRVVAHSTGARTTPAACADRLTAHRPDQHGEGLRGEGDLRDDGPVRTVRPVLLAPLLAAVLAACAAPEPPAPPPRPDPVADIRGTPPADPVDVCTNGVVHWAEVDLAGGEYYGDYQQRALSARQDQLRAQIVRDGRAAGGFTAAQVRERARAGCEALLAADPGPSGY